MDRSDASKGRTKKDDDNCKDEGGKQPTTTIKRYDKNFDLLQNM